MKKGIWIIVVLLCSVSLAAAQTAECPGFVNDALANLGTKCAAMGRNQACYGSDAIQVTPTQGSAPFKFDAVGDVADATSIQTLKLSALQQPSQWGLALLKLQADIPNTLPGQAVTMMLFGDTQIQDAPQSAAPAAPTPTPVTLLATPKSNGNVRSGPGTSNGVVGSLHGGTAITADGRNATNDWLHVTLADGSTGWAAASLLTVTGDISTLPVLSNSDTSAATPALPPIQAFYLMTGSGGPACGNLPDSGVLIQTPKGAGRVDLVLNEVKLSIGSTVFIQSRPNDYMTISTLEGEVVATVSLSGQPPILVAIPAGATVHIPTDANGVPSGAPQFVDSSAPLFDGVSTPVKALPTAITIAQPLVVAQVTDLLKLDAGSYTSTIQDVETTLCTTHFPQNKQGYIGQSFYTLTIDYDSTNNNFSINAGSNAQNLMMVSPGVYHFGTQTLYVTSNQSFTDIDVGVHTVDSSGKVTCSDDNGYFILDFVKK